MLEEVLWGASWVQWAGSEAHVGAVAAGFKRWGRPKVQEFPKGISKPHLLIPEFQ